MPTKLLIIVALICCIAFGIVGQTTAPLCCKLSAVADPEKPTIITVTIENSGAAPITVGRTVPDRDINVEIKTAAGVEAPLTDRGKYLRGPEGGRELQDEHPSIRREAFPEAGSGHDFYT
jgi:hypothetical protein